MNETELEYLTMQLNSFDHPIDFDYYIDVNQILFPDANTDDVTDVTDADIEALWESYWTCRSDLMDLIDNENE